MDNASTDSTAEVTKQCALDFIETRYIYEPRPGQTQARNAGLAAARGDIMLFTDDDVRPPHNWIEVMCTPILHAEAQAIAGGIRCAPHLKRDWMRPLHYGYLAITTWDEPFSKTQNLIGANMAFSRKVLSKVPQFDLELGPGALGFGDDTLFSMQLQKAGFKIAPALDVEVEHHFDESRLSYEAFLDSAQKRGRSTAYMAYHWEHRHVRFARLRWLRCRAALAYGRARQKRRTPHAEGISEWEMLAVSSVSFFQQTLIESRRPRNYERFGLQKRQTE